MQAILEIIIYVTVLIYSIILHEIAHGYIAYREGDGTAKWAGRLTLNPWPHVDIVGSIIVPILSYMSAGVAMGWAKGVPYNPHQLKHKYSEAKVAAAGVITNFLLAVIFAGIYRLVDVDLIKYISATVVIVNISLGIFNLLPLPPFDGMRILTSLFPAWGRDMNRKIDQNHTIFLLLSLFLAYNLWGYMQPIVRGVVQFLL